MRAAQGVEVKSFDQPEETRPFQGKGNAKMVHVAGRMVGLGTFEPGWRWSTNVQPIAGTPSCQASHLGYVLQGSMRIMMDDGSQEVITPGKMVAIAPGHDAEVTSDEPCIFLDFGEIDEYAKPH
jgi:hypothetical protein